MSAKQQRRRTPVRAVMRIVSQASASDQRFNFIGSEMLAGADGGVTGHEAEKVIQQHFLAGRTVMAGYVIDDGFQNRVGRTLPQDGRVTAQEQGAAAEIAQVESQFLQSFPVFQRASSSIGGQIDRL